MHVQDIRAAASAPPQPTGPSAFRLSLSQLRWLARLRQVARLAGPITVQMLSFTAMGLVDTLYVGWLGTGALAAVGFSAVASHFFHAYGSGMLAGVRIVVSQATGARQPAAGEAAARQGLLLSLAIGLPIMALALAAEPLLALFGASGEMLSLGGRWLGLRLLAAPFWFGTLALGGWFQGRGDTATPMRATLLANGLNILLDPLFIFGWGPWPALGIRGAALATVIGFAAGFLYLALRARAGLAGGRWLEPAALRRVLHLGNPSGVRALFEVGAWLAFSAMLAGVGEAAMAAHLVVIRVMSVSFLPGHAIGEAAGVLVGQAVGAGQERHARTAWTAAYALGLVVMGSFALAFLALPRLPLLPFGLSPEVMGVALELMFVAAIIQVFDAGAMVGLSALNGAGDTRFAMVLAVGSSWVIKLPLGYLLTVHLGWGAAGAWWALTAEVVVLFFATLARLRGRAWLQGG